MRAKRVVTKLASCALAAFAAGACERPSGGVPPTSGGLPTAAATATATAIAAPRQEATVGQQGGDAGERKQATSPPADGAAAAAIAKGVFRSEVLPKKPAVAGLDRLLDLGKPTAQKAPCRAVKRQLELHNANMSALTLHGSFASLDRDGDCWDVRWDGRRGTGVGAIVDAATGETLLIWKMPEG